MMAATARGGIMKEKTNQTNMDAVRASLARTKERLAAISQTNHDNHTEGSGK